MNFIFFIFNGFFKFTWFLQKKVMRRKSKEHKLYHKVKRIIFWASIGSLIISITVKHDGFLIVTMLLWISNFIIALISEVFNTLTLTTVRGFLRNGIVFSFSLFAILFSLIVLVTDKLNIVYNGLGAGVFMYFGVCLLLSLSWVFISTLASVKISIFINAILTTVLSIVMQIVNFIISWIPEKAITLGMSEYKIKELNEYGYATKQILNVFISTLILPVIIMLAMATIVCAMKKYWISKFNNGNDINEDYEKLLKSKIYSFSNIVPSELPESAGVYVIWIKNSNEALYVGRTRNIKMGLYKSHLMGNKSSARLKKYIVDDNENFPEIAEYIDAKEYLIENCNFQFILENENNRRGHLVGLFGYFTNARYIQSEY